MGIYNSCCFFYDSSFHKVYHFCVSTHCMAYSAAFSLSAMHCPTVFMYDNLPVLPGEVAPNLITSERAFGPEQDLAGIYATQQYSVAELFINRLRRSLHCPLTTDASKADLFLIPALSAPKGVTEWGKACKRSKNIGPLLAHLNAGTASRHIVLTGKG